MNTNPDNQTLMLWLEDELHGAEATHVDSWAMDQPVWLEKREAARSWRGNLRQVIPAAQEPPYPDFFQSKLMRAIEESTSQASAQPTAVRVEAWWRKLLTPAIAAAAMAVCFVGGTWFGNPPVDRAKTAVNASPAKSLVIYTPEEGVKAEFFESSPVDGPVIVLNGVAAIPDSYEVPDSAAVFRYEQQQKQLRAKESASLMTP